MGLLFEHAILSTICRSWKVFTSFFIIIKCLKIVVYICSTIGNIEIENNAYQLEPSEDDFNFVCINENEEYEQSSPSTPLTQHNRMPKILKKTGTWIWTR